MHLLLCTYYSYYCLFICTSYYFSYFIIHIIIFIMHLLFFFLLCTYYYHLLLYLFIWRTFIIINMHLWLICTYDSQTNGPMSLLSNQRNEPWLDPKLFGKHIGSNHFLITPHTVLFSQKALQLLQNSRTMRQKKRRSGTIGVLHEQLLITSDDSMITLFCFQFESIKFAFTLFGRECDGVNALHRLLWSIAIPVYARCFVDCE